MAVIDSQGAYYSIKGHNYNRAKQAISFKTDTLGDFVIYSDMTLFYVIAGLVGLVIIMVIALKILDVNRYKKARQAAKLAKRGARQKIGLVNRVFGSLKPKGFSYGEPFLLLESLFRFYFYIASL